MKKILKIIMIHFTLKHIKKNKAPEFCFQLAFTIAFLKKVSIPVQHFAPFFHLPDRTDVIT